MKPILLIIIASCLLASCAGSENKNADKQKEPTMKTDSTKQYGYNRDFLECHTEIIELKTGNSAIVLIPAWQGRVMTSTSEGDRGNSFGWINHELIKSGERLLHINAYGGEERLWLGPEGGQFSIFFSKGKSFEFDNWQTPEFLDTDPYKLVSSSDTSALFANDIETENYSGTSFKLRIEREVTLLSAGEIARQTSIDVSNLNYVAYRSRNTIFNKGGKSWNKKTGLLSVWMLGMFNPSPSVVVVIPVKEGNEQQLGPVVNDDYFGKIPEDRLKISGNHVFFKADGKNRGKIGIPPLRATGKMGSYDSENKALTLLLCELPESNTDYVNSSWQIQENPFSGDALNSYNDGPLDNGSQMGPFYELETSSPAAELKPGESLSHTQYTIHLTGSTDYLNTVSLKVLGLSIEDIIGAF